MKSIEAFVLILGFGAYSASAQVVESPTTAAPGVWLIESDLGFANWDRSGRGVGRVDVTEIGLAPIFLSTGVNETLDLQFGFDGWLEAKETRGGRPERASGWGDTWVRAKWNFAGDESVESAWAILPYVKLPTADSEVGNGKVEPGLALVFGRPLDESNWFEAQVSLDSLHHETAGREENLFAGMVVGHNINPTTSVYAELLLEWTRGAGGDIPVTVGVGISPAVTPGLALDIEILIGVSEEATDLGVALRLVWEL